MRTSRFRLWSRSYQTMDDNFPELEARPLPQDAKDRRRPAFPLMQRRQSGSGREALIGINEPGALLLAPVVRFVVL